MSHQLSNAPGAEAPAVLFCCAEDDEIPLVGVVAELRNRGYNPEILTGVDLDTTVLGKAVDATPGAGLFVLCESEDLDRFQIRRLEGVFSARSGPRHEVFSVKVADGPRVVGQVEQRLGRMGGTKEARGGGSSTLRDVVTPAAAKNEAMARELLQAMVETEAKLANLDSDDDVGSHSTLDIQDAPTEAELGGAAAVAASDSATHLVNRAESVEIDLDDEDEGDTQADGPTETTSPMRAVDAPAEAKSGGALPLLLGLAVVAGGGYFGWQHLQQQESEAARAAAPRAQPAAAKEAPAPTREGSSPAKQEAPPADPGTAAAAAGPDEGSGGEATGEVPPAPAGDDPPPEGASTDGPTEEPTPPEATRAEDPAGDSAVNAADTDKIEAALERGEIRALDGLLMHVPNEPEMPWMEAANTCKKKKYAGVFGWKLPSLKNLRTLRKARMLPRGSWWSTTLSDVEAKDEVYVVNTSQRMPVTWLKAEPNARALCVRRRW